MAKKGNTDTDLGMEKILEEMKKLGELNYKVGIPEGPSLDEKSSPTKKKGDDKIEGTRIVEYATYNEYGVPNDSDTMKETGKIWRIPPRPFLRQWLEYERPQRDRTEEKVIGLVLDGKIDADTAIRRVAENAVTGVKKSIRNGAFEGNEKSTISKKGSSRPLIDTGAMRQSIGYQIVKKK